MTVTLYYTPFACSLSCHMALKAANIPYKVVRVDLGEKKTEDGEDYLKISSTGAVPSLKLEDGTILTQNLAILSYLGAVSKRPSFFFEDNLKQARLLEALAFDGDLHSGVASHIFGSADDAGLKRRMNELEAKLPATGYWLGTSEPSQADLYTATIINWTTNKNYDLSPWPKAAALYKKIFESDVAKEAIKEEGL